MTTPRLQPGGGRRILGIIRWGLFRSAAPPALRLSGAVLQFLATLLVARSLGATLSGLFFYWSSIFRSAGQVSTFGLDRIALKEIPRLGENPVASIRYLAPVRFIVLCVALLVSGLVIAFSLTVGEAVARPGWWYVLPPICVAGVALCMLNGDAMTAVGRPLLGVFYRHTLPTAAFLILVVTPVESLTSDQILAGFCLTFLMAGLVSMAGARPRIGVPPWGELRAHLRVGSPVFLCLLFTALTNVLPLVFLNWDHSSDQVAFALTALRISILFEVLSTAVHSTTMPQLSRAAESGSHLRFGKVYLGAVAKGALLLGPPMAIALIFADPIMAIFGTEFREAGVILQTCLAFGLISLALGPATYAVLMVGKTGHMATNALVRLICTAALATLMIPEHGPLGMAVALGSGAVLEKVLCLIRAWKCGGKGESA